MKYIISGTDRVDSNTFKVSKAIQNIYKELGEEVEIIDLKEVKEHLHTGPHYGKDHDPLVPVLNKIAKSDGLIVVTPEYNGSMPGVLKYFIDHMKFPESFEFRPICFVGIGALFGGLRPVEHLQQVFGYRNSYIYPLRVFMMNVWTKIKDLEITDPVTKDLLVTQAKGFQAFTQALVSAKIHANDYAKTRVKK